MNPLCKIDVEAILISLNAKQTGEVQYMAQCPSHGDDKPSLAIKVLNPSQAIFHCHAGCSFKDIIKALAKHKMLKGK